MSNIHACPVCGEADPAQFWYRQSGRYAGLRADARCKRCVNAGIPNPDKQIGEPLAHHFWEHIDIRGPDDCWLWHGPKDIGGYGRLKFQGRTTGAHRVAWTKTHGPIPKGKWVLHHCDNPACVYPKHLFLGDYNSNAQDRNEKGRQARGSTHGSAQLTEWLVRDMRRRYKTGKYTVHALADMFYTSVPTVQNILAGRIWKHIL